MPRPSAVHRKLYPLSRAGRASAGKAPARSFRAGVVCAALLLSCGRLAGALPLPPPPTVPPADHVIVVVMENKFYQDVWTAPYTASLIATGSMFTESYAITHPSQPNYLALWAGSTLGVTDNSCPPPGAPFAVPNLGAACEAAGVSWRAYAENLPYPSFTGCISADSLYVRKHAPWTEFSNLDHQRERRFADLAADVAHGTLPRLAFVLPNQCDNTHDCPVSTGDAWLAANMPGLIQDAGSAGVVILTWDEDDSYHSNHILTVFAGGLVKSGYVSTRSISHYTVLRTICDCLGVVPPGAAAAETPITDVWVPPADVADVPTGFGRITVRPNPSSRGFEARVELSQDTSLEATVYDASGRRVAPLWRGTGSGDLLLRWDGRWEDGRLAAAGPYFLRLSSGSGEATEKLILIR